MNSRSAVVRRWALPVLIVALFAVAGIANAHGLMSRSRPSVLGLVLSAAYALAWLVHAFDAGRRRIRGSVRRMVAIWAVATGAIVIFGTYLRVGSGGGPAPEFGGWVVPAVLLAICAPLYGLVALLAADPLVVLAAVSVGCAALTVAAALVGRRIAPDSAPAGHRLPAPTHDGRVADQGPAVEGLSRG